MGEWIAFGGAIVAAGLSGLFALHAQRQAVRAERELREEDRRAEHEAIMSRYKGPLVHAAYDLQSRLWNIICQRFVASFYPSGGERRQRYIVDNTLFVIGQYFCWIEIIRREVQLLDIGDETLPLSQLRDQIYGLWQTSDLPEPFMIWAGEQRAIGESMILETERGQDCMGYARFSTALANEEIPVPPELRADIVKLATEPRHGRERLVLLQAALVRMLDLLDPNCEYFPPDRRGPADPCPPRAGQAAAEESG